VFVVAVRPPPPPFFKPSKRVSEVRATLSVVVLGHEFTPLWSRVSPPDWSVFQPSRRALPFERCPSFEVPGVCHLCLEALLSGRPLSQGKAPSLPLNPVQ